MLPAILKTIYSKYQATDTNGIFLSGYDKDGKILISQGILEPGKTIEDTTKQLYDTYLQPLKQIDLVIIDVVKNIVEQKEYTVVLNLDPHDYGLIIKMIDPDDHIWVLLPGTAEVADMAHAIYAIKQKYNLTGDVILYTFQTDRLAYTRELEPST